jgi:hypothetical protein
MSRIKCTKKKFEISIAHFSMPGKNPYSDPSKHTRFVFSQLNRGFNIEGDFPAYRSDWAEINLEQAIKLRNWLSEAIDKQTWICCNPRNKMRSIYCTEHESFLKNCDEYGEKYRVIRGILKVDCLCDLCNAEMLVGQRALAVTMHANGPDAIAPWEHEYLEDNAYLLRQ